MNADKYIIYIEKDEDGMFLGSIPSIPACFAEGKTQEEMINNLTEVLGLCLKNMKDDEIKQTKFVGIQSIDFTYA